MTIPVAKPPVIFIMGPTASGKTDLAIALRAHLPVEIISVDSAQVYKTLDIGSAKVASGVRKKHPHALIDIRDPSEVYSVADFLQDAKRHIKDISARGNIPLLVGGTMMYFKILYGGLSDLPRANSTVRDEILRRATEQGWQSLHDELTRLDPETARKLHPNHSQRIQRALEVIKITGKPLSALQVKVVDKGLEHDYRVVPIALISDNRQLLHERIEQRFLQMMKLGLLDEVRALHQRDDLSPDLPAMRAAGYQQLWQHLDGHFDIDEAINRAVVASRQLAKRQFTWLRKWSDAERIIIDDGEQFLSCEKICKQTLKILSNHSIL